MCHLFFLPALLVRVVPPPSSFTGDDDDDNDNFIYKQYLEAQTAPEVNSSELPQCLCSGWVYFVGATGRPVLISSEAFNHIPVIRWGLQSTQILILKKKSVLSQIGRAEKLNSQADLFARSSNT